MRADDLKLFDVLLLPAMSRENLEATDNRERVDAADWPKCRLLRAVLLPSYLASGTRQVPKGELLVRCLRRTGS
jgi:hypothetical protein